jgi:hypothetical protein
MLLYTFLTQYTLLTQQKVYCKKPFDHPGFEQGTKVENPQNNV